MGCSESKVKQQKAVALCRCRADLLAAAIRHRDALAAAHADYSRSLFSVSSSLHSLLRSPSSSPFIPLHLITNLCNSEPSPPPTQQPVSSARHSNSSSHIKFLPSDSDDFDDDDSPLHSGGCSPLHCLDHHYETVVYARSQPPSVPSISGSQQSQRYETVQVSSFDAAYPSYDESYHCFARNYDSVNQFFCLSSPILAIPPSDTTEASAVGRSSSSTVPPPPPQPTTSALDFLNPFETSEAYSSHFYTPSWSSREEREEEGIPDLEEEEVVVEEANGQNHVAFSHVEWSPATTSSNCRDEVVDKDVIEDKPEKSQMEQNNVAEKMVNFHEMTIEIKAQFEKAWQSAGELSKLLEVGNHQYHPKHSLYRVSSRMINVVPPRLSYGVLDFDGDKVTGSRSLASTLQKLYIWERKLYHEVKSEEEMRLLLRRRHKELRCLVDKGAEAHKVGSMRTAIKKLSTKIRIAIQVVHSISKKINRLRDEELQPRTTELVRGLARMWNILLKCHQMQCKEMSETERLDLVVSAGGLSTNHADEIMQFELEMIKWACSFSSWINAQNNFVKALNGWLALYLNCEYELEATIDRVPPYSLSRMGAPPVFIIYSRWSQAMNRTSRSEVLESMQSFSAATHSQWEHQNVEQHESMAGIKDMHRWFRTMKKNQKNRDKEVSSLFDKKLDLAPTCTALCNIDEESRVDSGLKRILEIMKDFAATSVKAYQELLELCEEHRINVP